MFNRGGGPITFDPLNRLDRQMNVHLFLFGPTGSGKSATLNNLLNQVTALYRPRLLVVVQRLRQALSPDRKSDQAGSSLGHQPGALMCVG
ncbi:hypothetical protein N018_12740 [Pseudomonas syringae CC1557]|uniref:Uncharacterized protein n=1 Tax=Pseudomonas syringae CC1557 TaxID=1357279 RepID=W0N3G6_PSESX|nr:hypothetical protein N018_12740 [Pseudomonas syringae CC1557]